MAFHATVAGSIPVIRFHAVVVELVDIPALEAGAGNSVQVRFLSAVLYHSNELIVKYTHYKQLEATWKRITAFGQHL